VSEESKPKKRVRDESESSDESAPKKQKTCKSDSESGDESETLPKYHFVEKQNLSLPTEDYRIDMDQIVVSSDYQSLYTDGCISCAALIVVTEMNNGGIYHGLCHCSQMYSGNNVDSAFRDIKENIKSETAQKIIGADYYIVINPQYKSGYVECLNEIHYKINKFYPELDPKIGMVDTSVPGANTGYMNVKVSSGLIEVDYTQAERS